MLEPLVKLFGFIKSKKTAFIVLLTCLLFVYFSEAGIEFAKEKGVSNDDSTNIVIALFWASALMLTGWLIYIWSFLIKVTTQVKLKYQKNKQKEFTRINLETAIPQLPIEQLEILIELSQGEERLNLKQGKVFYLFNQGFIKKLHQISANEFVFKIDSLVKSVLIVYLEKQRKVCLDNFTLNITEEQRQFLSIFFNEGHPLGTEESGLLMDSNVYKTSDELCKMDIIKQINTGNENKTKYVLTEDIGKILSEEIINQPIVRHEIELDNNFIAVSVGSGAGALGSN